MNKPATASLSPSQLSDALAKTYSIPPALGERLDAMYSYAVEREDSAEDQPAQCPVLAEAQELSSFLLSCLDDQRNAMAIDRDPWNGVDYEDLRSRALFTLRQVDRYLAARKARFGVDADRNIAADVVREERRKLRDE